MKILNKFIDDEQNYFNIDNPHFEFLKVFIEKEFSIRFAIIYSQIEIIKENKEL